MALLSAQKNYTWDLWTFFTLGPQFVLHAVPWGGYCSAYVHTETLLVLKLAVLVPLQLCNVWPVREK